MRNGRVLGVGSPLVDLLARVPDSYLEFAGGAKGGMEMVDSVRQRELVDRLPVVPDRAPGGSAANTVFGLARLGHRGALLGKLGADETAGFYRAGMRAAGLDESCLIVGAGQTTGICLSLVTPDTERTMRSDLGASATLAAAEVESVDFTGFDLVLIEGYLLFLPGEVFETVLRKARAAGCEVAFDLASFEVVRIFRDRILEALAQSVDIVFANADESVALWGEIPETAQLEKFAELCPVAALKLGRRGALVAIGDERAEVAAHVVEALDTTAAGDLWAAGFLHGYLCGESSAVCGDYGARTAAEVVQVMGTGISDAVWKKLNIELGN